VDHLVATLEHDRRIGPARGQPRHAPHLGQQLGWPQERFRGHARVVRALAADELRLDDRHVEAGLAEPAGDDLPGRPGAEHDDVERSLHPTILDWLACWS
jgi:hypothetical protein